MARTSAPTFRELPGNAQAYIGGLTTAAAVLVAVTSLADSAPSLDPTLLVIAVLLCAAANLLEVFAPGHYSFQPNLVFFFWGALVLPPWAIAVLSVVSFLPGWVRHRFRWYMVVFNVVNYTLGGLAAHALGRLGDLTGAPSAAGVGALVLAAIAFVSLNLGLIAVVVSLARGRPVRESVRDMLESLPLDFALAMTGACLAVLWQEAPILTVLASGPMLLVYRALWVPLLEQKTRTDPKTGLANTEHLETVFADALATADKNGGGFAVVMVDLDHLRAVNNGRGHLAGDKLLQAAAKEVLKHVEPNDTAARFGGDEFCLVLRGRSLASARVLAEEIRAGVETISISWGQDAAPLRTTVSAGVAAYPEHGETVNALVSAADAAVYDAKLGGRNRVRTALPPGTRDALEMSRPPAGGRRGAPARPVEAGPERASLGLDRVSSGANGSSAATADALERPAPDPASDVSEPVEEAGEDAPSPSSRRLIPWLTAALWLVTGTVALLSGGGPIGHAPILFVVLVASFVALDQIRIDIFERANISPAAIPVLVLAYEFGPLGPVVAEGALAVVRAVRREPLIKWTFDFGALALAGVAAALVFRLFDAHSGAALLGLGALAGFAYYVVNTFLLAAVMGLAEGKGSRHAWQERLAWLFPHYVCFGMLAGLFVVSERELDLYALGIFAIPLLTVWLAQKQYLARSRSSVAELRRSHEELELTNQRLRTLLNDNRELLARMHRSYLSTITSLARTIEAKDPYTGGHTERVAEIALTLARELGFNQRELQAVNVGALIHDIGKIGVPDKVLLKEGPLTDEEFAEIREHPKISSYIVADLELPPIVKQMVRSHHERFDGHGYPDGLEGEEIPMSARILAVADAFDAMTSDRPYRGALPLEEACAEIRAMAGRQFCPKVVSALNACVRREPAFLVRLGLTQPSETVKQPPAARRASA